MRKRHLLGVIGLILLATGATGAMAIWLGGFVGFFTLEATSGSQPSAVTCDGIFHITDGNPVTFGCPYNNEDGTVTMQFTCDDSNITSTDPKCNYETGEDIEIYIGLNGADYDLCSGNPAKILNAGSTDITVKVVPHANRCSLIGSFDVTGTLI